MTIFQILTDHITIVQTYRSIFSDIWKLIFLCSTSIEVSESPNRKKSSSGFQFYLSLLFRLGMTDENNWNVNQRSLPTATKIYWNFVLLGNFRENISCLKSYAKRSVIMQFKPRIRYIVDSNKCVKLFLILHGWYILHDFYWNSLN